MFILSVLPTDNPRKLDWVSITVPEEIMKEGFDSLLQKHYYMKISFFFFKFMFQIRMNQNVVTKGRTWGEHLVQPSHCSAII